MQLILPFTDDWGYLGMVTRRLEKKRLFRGSVTPLSANLRS